jgi:hypothetical protein
VLPRSLSFQNYRVFRAQADWTLISPSATSSRFQRKRCATCREKCRRAAPRTEKLRGRLIRLRNEHGVVGSLAQTTMETIVANPDVNKEIQN